MDMPDFSIPSFCFNQSLPTAHELRKCHGDLDFKLTGFGETAKGVALRILLAEKDESISHQIMRELARIGFVVERTDCGLAAERMLGATPFDAALLSCCLPGQSGFAVLASLRAARNPVPVVMLSDSDLVSERVRGLNTGADDFLAKPFAFAELQARLNAVLRRSCMERTSELRCGPLVYDSGALSFHVEGSYLSLTPRECAMLATLIEKAGHVVPRSTLARRAFTAQGDMNLDAVEVVIHRLRKKLANTAVNVETIRGAGYRLVCAEPAED